MRTRLQVAKAQIEKAEVKADMAAARIEVMKELGQERERCVKLEETELLLREQVELYQGQLDSLQVGRLFPLGLLFVQYLFNKKKYIQRRSLDQRKREKVKRLLEGR